MVACLAVYLRFSITTATVSAKEVLERVDQAETRALRQVARPVVRQVLRIRRAGAGETTVEVWSDAARQRFGQRGEDRLWREFGAVLEANHLTGMSPVAGRTFSAWRSSIKVADERVVRASTDLTVETTAAGPFHDRQIVEGELTVRDNGWTPVRQSWRVQEGDAVEQYTVEQVDLEVLPENALDPVLFAGLPERASRTDLVPAPPLPPLPENPPPSATVRPDLQDTEDLEMDVRLALHRRGDCLTGALQVVRSAPGKIVIRGVIEDEAQKQQLLAALPTSPALEKDIRTLDEAVAPSPAEVPSFREITLPPTGEIPGAELLRQKHYDAQGITRLANEAFRLSRNARREAWALRRLAERYGPKETGALSPAARQKLERMLAEHLLHLRRAISDGRSLLSPLVSADLAPSSPRAERAAWSSELLSLVASVEQMDSLVQDLFTASGTSPEQVEPKMRDLGSVFASLERDFQTVEKYMALSISPGTQP